ncbi:MAG: hypothetical protein IT320_24215 [Anaerolineae bacterium]|nr:hypothetical protein [Anaerolineae bacterium]
MSQDIDYRAVRREVEAEVVRRKRAARWIFFGVNLMMFGVFLIIAASIISGSGASDGAMGALAMMSAGWFIGLVFQFISAMLDTKSFEDRIRTEVMSQALGKHLLGMSREEEPPDEKPKRTYSLSTDGELDTTPVDDTDATEARTLILRRRR